MPITVCQHLSFNLGNAFKYACRAPFSEDGKRDMEKGLDYLAMEIKLTNRMLDYSLAQREAAIRALEAFERHLMLADLPPEGMTHNYRRALSVFISALGQSFQDNHLASFIVSIYCELTEALR